MSDTDIRALEDRATALEEQVARMLEEKSRFSFRLGQEIALLHKGLREVKAMVLDIAERHRQHITNFDRNSS